MRLLAARLAALGFLRTAIPRLVRSFAPDPREPKGRAWSCSPGVSGRDMAWMRQVSHVPGESFCAYAVPSDPGGTRGSGHTVHGRGPRNSSQDEGSLQCGFRGSIARPQHWLSTPRGQSLPCTARKTRFRLPASSTGRDWLPAGFQRKVSKYVSLHDSSPFPKFYVTRGSPRRVPRNERMMSRSC